MIAEIVKKYWPFVLLDIKMSRRVILMFEMIFWPVLSLASLGIFTLFIKSNFYTKMFLFTGAIGWSCIHFCQHAIGRGFLSEVWHDSMKQTFSSPITLKNFIIGHWLFGIIGSVIGFFVMSTIALLFFDFNLFSLGIFIPVILLLAVLCSLIIGITSLSLVLLFGMRVDFIIWSLTDMVVFISGVYYSIAVFPPPVQFASHLFPVIYVFEGMRAVLTGASASQIFLNGFVVALVWVLFGLFAISKIEKYAKKTGFYERYG
jgi:ABC-2 type transport system permease protein